MPTWRQHLTDLRWKQGEHVFIAAPTSAGKTTLMSSLVRKRSHVVVMVSKLRDDAFTQEFKGWTRLEEWPKGGPPPWMTNILLWPKPVKENLAATVDKQRDVFAHAFNHIGYHGNRCVVVDEMLMMCDPKFIGLEKSVGHLHYFGRSSGISMVTLSQRPAWIPRVVRSSATHAYVAKTVDTDDLKSLAEMGGVDKREVADQLMRLSTRHDYLYLNPQGDAPRVSVNTRR